jgi:hypothetical protein
MSISDIETISSDAMESSEVHTDDELMTQRTDSHENLSLNAMRNLIVNYLPYHLDEGQLEVRKDRQALKSSIYVA